MKKLLICTLAFVLICSEALLAKNEKGIGYDQCYGKIEEVATEGQNSEILVKNERAGKGLEEELFLYTAKVPVLDLSSGELLENYPFKKGEKIQYFYRQDTPVLTSLPAKMTPDWIAVHLDEATYSLDVDFFDKKGQGISNRLKMEVDQDTVAKNKEGRVEKDFLNKDLAVLYREATRSIPPIAKPYKIFILDKKNPVVDIENYRDSKSKGIYLRKYFEALGAKVEWKGEENLTRISMGDKVVDIKNKEACLKIGEKVEPIKGFSYKGGVSILPEKYLHKINDYLLA